MLLIPGGHSKTGTDETPPEPKQNAGPTGICYFFVFYKMAPGVLERYRTLKDCMFRIVFLDHWIILEYFASLVYVGMFWVYFGEIFYAFPVLILYEMTTLL